MATLTLTSTKKSAASDGVLKVRYLLRYTANNSNDNYASLTGIANAGTWGDAYPDNISVAVVADQDNQTEIDVQDGPTVVQSFDFSDEDFDVLMEFNAAPTDGDECDVIIVHEFWDAASQDGSSITAS